MNEEIRSLHLFDLTRLSGILINCSIFDIWNTEHLTSCDWIENATFQEHDEHGHDGGGTTNGIKKLETVKCVTSTILIRKWSFGTLITNFKIHWVETAIRTLANAWGLWVEIGKTSLIKFVQTNGTRWYIQIHSIKSPQHLTVTRIAFSHSPSVRFLYPSN